MTKVLNILIPSALLLLGLCASANEIEPSVFCKAKILGANGGSPVFADFKYTQEDDLAKYYAVKIGRVEFEIQSFKTVFFYKPTIRSEGSEVTTSGFFSAARTIHLDWTIQDQQGQKVNANLRCCNNCTFSDWP